MCKILNLKKENIRSSRCHRSYFNPTDEEIHIMKEIYGVLPIKNILNDDIEEERY